ncbi:MAG: glycosyltransferase [Chloroflexota bacterium]|nr:glycosyltransferase [Chloroflexota bacterium]
MDGLFAAFARAADRDRELRLVIVGSLGKLAGLMREALSRSRLDPARVVVAGGVDDVTLAALYAGAECLLHAAWLEGFGLTALEALAAGTPVVGYRAGAVAEVVGDAGLLVDDRDPDALGEALATVLGDESLRSSLRARAKPRAARFSWDRAADDTLAIYRTLT